MSSVRSSQVIQQVLTDNTTPTNVRASQVVQQVLESDSRTTNVFVSQVVMQVLRSVSSISYTGQDKDLMDIRSGG